MKKIKKSQTFYILKFFYYFLLIVPVIIYLIGIKKFVGDVKIELKENYESKAFFYLLAPENKEPIYDTPTDSLTRYIKENLPFKEKNSKKEIENFLNFLMGNSLLKKSYSNYYIYCKKEKDTLFSSYIIICDYRFI